MAIRPLDTAPTNLLLPISTCHATSSAAKSHQAHARQMIRRNAIFFLIDKNIFPAAIFQATRLASLNPRDDTDICVISDSANDVALAKDFAAPCRIIYLDPSMVKVPMNQAYASRVSYYRAYVPSLLAGEYRRILHLDADIAIENDKIFSLFDIEMGGHPIAAVRTCRPTWLS
jgi:lipopolysaccharide biosynthesis glycosyltransferase